ncbi:MAG TPA: flagellar hook-basal body complex protein FliE [Spongiibacteraceae bacterium]|jgi:flagellar hook-basal body complex protein FliE
MKVERADVNQLLQQMRQMQSQINEQRGVRETASMDGLNPLQQTLKSGAGANVNNGESVKGFGEMFQQAIGSVNATQQQAGALATSFEQGDPQVSLAQVMVASQKASVSFQALTQVRNRLVDAYKDIMNMPI